MMHHNFEDLRSFLRSGTEAEHKDLDELFLSVDLTDRHGYAAFVASHMMGWASAWTIWAHFAQTRLNLPVLDYPAMMAGDLAQLGFDPGDLPPLAMPETPSAAGVVYVLAGSRMGIATIRRQPNWGAEHGRADAYLSDESGGPAFRTLLDWMKGPEGQAADRDAALQSAKATFGLFAQAFECAQKKLAPKNAAGKVLN